MGFRAVSANSRGGTRNVIANAFGTLHQPATGIKGGILAQFRGKSGQF